MSVFWFFFRNKKYGALSNECGEAHFQYGKSLLELARSLIFFIHE